MTAKLCEICGDPMPDGETMFKFHGYSGPCPRPPLKKTPPAPAWHDASVLEEVATERQRQDAKWGGSRHDDLHSTALFIQLIDVRNRMAAMADAAEYYSDTRKRLIQVAALAVAAVESMGRTITKAEGVVE